MAFPWEQLEPLFLQWLAAWVGDLRHSELTIEPQLHILVFTPPPNPHTTPHTKWKMPLRIFFSLALSSLISNKPLLLELMTPRQGPYARSQVGSLAHITWTPGDTPTPPDSPCNNTHCQVAQHLCSISLRGSMEALHNQLRVHITNVVVPHPQTSTYTICLQSSCLHFYNTSFPGCHD